MKIVLFGPPAAGKGTQAEKITNLYNIPHISTGDLLRRNIEEKTEIGLVALGFIERGKLAPDDVVIELLKQSIAGLDGYLLDGFPRTLNQARLLEDIADIDIVFDIEIREDHIVDRIVNRMVCPHCGKSYDKKSHPRAVCDDDGVALTMRHDDTEEIARERIRIYKTQTAPIIDFYRVKGKLVSIDGEGSIDEVFENIKKAIYDYCKK